MRKEINCDICDELKVCKRIEVENIYWVCKTCRLSLVKQFDKATPKYLKHTCLNCGFQFYEDFITGTKFRVEEIDLRNSIIIEGLKIDLGNCCI